MTLREREDTGTLNGKHSTALSGNPVDEEPMGLSQDRLYGDDDCL